MTSEMRIKEATAAMAKARKAAALRKEREFGMDDSFTTHDTPFTRTFGGMPYNANIYDH